MGACLPSERLLTLCANEKIAAGACNWQPPSNGIHTATPAARMQRVRNRSARKSIACPGDVSGLPLHPIGLCRLKNRLSFANNALRLRTARKKSGRPIAQRKQITMNSNMPEFMGQGRAQPVLSPHILIQADVYLDRRLPTVPKFGYALVTCPEFLGRGIQVKIFRFALDEFGEVVGRNGNAQCRTVRWTPSAGPVDARHGAGRKQANSLSSF